MVFYRKYRPQTLDDLVGQEHIKSALKKAFLSGHLAHAYLFCGPKGVGKTSTARILAKLVNCEKSQTEGNPCDKCSVCKSIADGSNLDLIEIDAASNRGIDDIRALRENIKLTPSSAKKKVYIIDEVHMLSNEAFNALLKTLEEPPEHVLFILATTEVQKIPATILSRVAKMEFKGATEAELVQAIKKVVKKEGLEVDEKGILAIVKRSEGSFRDGLKLLDQVASSNQKITQELVEEYFNSGSFNQVEDFIKAIALKDIKKSVEVIGKQVEVGVNIKEFSLEVISNLRLILLLKHNVLPEQIEGERLEGLKKLAEGFSLDEIIEILELLNKSLEKLKFVTISSLPLEIAVIQFLSPKKPQVVVSSIQEVKQEVTVLTEPIKIKVEVDEKVKDSKASSKDLPQLLERWSYILETIKPYNYSLEALLKQVKIISCEEGLLILEVPYSFHQRILEAPKSRTLLESVLSDVLNKSIRVSCVLGKRPLKVEELANFELAADDEIVKIASEIFNS